MSFKYIFIVILLVLSQTVPGKAQIVIKKSTSVEAYYGYPDWWTILFKPATGSSGIYNINTRGQGPVGLRLDHLLNRRIGLGLDIWYVNTKITGLYNPNNNFKTTNNVTFSANLLRLNALARMTIHIARHEKFDPYFHFGLGYLYSSYNFESSNKGLYNVANPLPQITGRLGMGLKYYFNPDLGIVIDVGLGGPLISLGLFKRWLKKDKKDKNEVKDEIEAD